MASRGNGEGSVVGIRNRRTGKKDRWVGKYMVTLSDGTRKQVETSPRRKRREDAARDLATAMGKANGSGTYEAARLTVGDYLDLWLADSVKGSVKASTERRYEQLSRLHLKPAFGRTKLDKLNPGNLRRLYQDKLAAGSKPRTVNYMHRTMSKCLKQAVADGLLQRNVAEAVTPPQPERQEIHPLTRDEVHALFSAASDERMAALYVVAVHTGMRQGELLGLRWSDLDLDRSRLSVSQSLDFWGKEPKFSTPKTGRGRRVDLTPEAVAALRAHRGRQHAERLAATEWQDTDLVFPDEGGKPLRPWRISGTSGLWQRLVRDAGLSPDTRFHDLRHTCATLLLTEGVHPKLVQTLLGHASISITLDTYSHVLPSMGDLTAVAMTRALS